MPKRSALNFWLLLAATVGVNLVVLSMAIRRGALIYGYFQVGVYGLIVSQWSVVCIWSALRATSIVGRLLVPMLMVAIASLAATWISEPDRSSNAGKVFASYLGIFGTHALVLIAAIWLLARTAYWRRQTGAAPGWRFSLLQVLGLMTLLAILLTIMRNSEFFGAEVAMNIAISIECMVLAIASVFLWSLPWHGFLKLACVLGLALLLGVAAVLMMLGPAGLQVFDVGTLFPAFFLIQGIVLSSWLACVPILPEREEANADLVP